MNRTESKYWNASRTQYGIRLIVTNGFVSVISCLILQMAMGGNGIYSAVCIPLFFCIMGFLQFFFLEKGHKQGTPHTTLYLALKTFKLIISVVLMVVYGLVIRKNIVIFGLLLIVFYLINLISDTLFFVKFEKGYKK